MLQLSKLNGWQRLWIVISLILLLPTIYYSYITKPNNEPIYNEWAGKLIELAINNDPSLSNYKPWEIAQLYSDIPPDQFVDKLLSKYMVKQPEFKFRVDSLNTIYQSKLEQNTVSFWFHLFISFGGWIGSIFLLYIIGYAVFWVKEGFKQ